MKIGAWIHDHDDLSRCHHPKIWNVEQSPIHTAFGLCDTAGEPKFDLEDIL